MKQIWKEIGMAMILGIVIPGIVLNGTVWITGTEKGLAEDVCKDTEGKTK